MNVHDASALVQGLAADLNEALDEIPKQVRAQATAERDYRKARAQAWATTAGQGMLAKQREDQVNADTADLRYDRDLAEGLRRAAHEKVRACEDQISAVQSLLSAHREEAKFARTGPEMTQ